jgi:hypothetical protein
MLKGILSISGHSGLFKIVAESKNNIIVESITTKKRMPAYSTSKISSLEDIAIFTATGEVALKDIFKRIFELENGGIAPIAPDLSDAGYKSYFEKVLPEYDKERVYLSDIKKLFVWYNLLHENDLLKFEEEVSDDQKPEGSESEINKESGNVPSS